MLPLTPPACPPPDALARGDIDVDAMRYYLIQDHRFIDDFVVLLSSMVCMRA